MSNQCCPIQSRHVRRLPLGPVTIQPPETGIATGHIDYWPSWLRSTTNAAFSSSNIDIESLQWICSARAPSNENINPATNIYHFPRLRGYQNNGGVVQGLVAYRNPCLGQMLARKRRSEVVPVRCFRVPIAWACTFTAILQFDSLPRSACSTTRSPCFSSVATASAPSAR